MFLDWVYNTDPALVMAVLVAASLAGASVCLVAIYALVDRATRHGNGELAYFTVSNMAVLYAVLLAFIAVATWETLSKAGEVTQTEANLVGELYRDTAGLPGPDGDGIRGQIRAYLKDVIDTEWPIQQQGKVSTVGWVHLKNAHRLIAAIQPTTPSEQVLMPEMLRGLNDLYAARTSRLNAVQEHVPPPVWWVILYLGGLTIIFACLVKAESFWMHWLMLAGLTVALTLVVVLIVELDYPFRGVISVKPEAFVSVLNDLAGA